jgi:hypothetical protein
MVNNNDFLKVSIDHAYLTYPAHSDLLREESVKISDLINLVIEKQHKVCNNREKSSFAYTRIGKYTHLYAISIAGLNDNPYLAIYIKDKNGKPKLSNLIPIELVTDINDELLCSKLTTLFEGIYLHKQNINNLYMENMQPYIDEYINHFLK